MMLASMFPFRPTVMLQDPLFQGGLVAAIIAVVRLQSLDSSFDDSHQGLVDMLGACMQLVLERGALLVKDGLFPSFCLECLTASLDKRSVGSTSCKFLG